MASRTVLVDDLDNSERMVTTTSFSLDGRDYEIDLSSKNLNALRKVLAPFVESARVTGSKTVRKSGTSKSGDSKKASRDDLAEVREWARENGYEVAERGRVPRKVRDAYDRRHQGVAA